MLSISARRKARGRKRKTEQFKEVGAGPSVKHLARFFESVRTRKLTVEGVQARTAPPELTL